MPIDVCTRITLLHLESDSVSHIAERAAEPRAAMPPPTAAGVTRWKDQGKLGFVIDVSKLPEGSRFLLVYAESEIG